MEDHTPTIHLYEKIDIRIVLITKLIDYYIKYTTKHDIDEDFRLEALSEYIRNYLCFDFLVTKSIYHEVDHSFTYSIQIEDKKYEVIVNPSGYKIH